MTEQELVKEIKDRFREAFDAVNQHYTEAVQDAQFFKGDGQWPTDLQGQREADGRPCLVINKIPTFADQIIGDIRQNEPAIKIKPVDSKADPETAEILNGLIRNIETQNEAEVAYDTAAENVVITGYGAWRVGTDYTADDQFEQDITISRIKNPFTVYWDPQSQKFDRSDARYCFVTEKISKEEFQRQYPDASISGFDSGKDTSFYWGDAKSVRIVEYWHKEPVTKTLYLVQKTDVMTGAKSEIYVTDMKPDPGKLGPEWQVLKDRKVETYKVKWCKATQSEVIEKEIDWPGKYIPIVSVYGKELNIEGDTYYRGIVRNAKDPQRLYNYSRSTGAEVISLAPKAPYLVTAKMISNYQGIWDQAHKRSYPYLPYEPDPSNPQIRPFREPPIMANTGIQQEIIIADQEMHDVTGLQLASLGKKSNEKSGRAILARQREGDVANFAYYDNLARAIKYSAKVILDLIPYVYDTPRIVRILNRDGTDKFVPINQPTAVPGPNGEPLAKVFDLTKGKYDVVVAVGPSYTTQRDEAADNMIAFIQAVPQAGPLILDLLARNMDWPGADEIEKRLKLLLPPQLQQGIPGQPPAPPPPPDPMQIMMLKKAEGEAQLAQLMVEEKFHHVRRLREDKPSEPKEPKDAPKKREE